MSYNRRDRAWRLWWWGVCCISTLAFSLSGEPSSAQPVTDSAPNGGHATLVDALGDTLEAANYPDRIVSLSPSLTESLFALGVARDRIVGVTRYCDYPEQAKNCPQVGGIVDPSLEAIQRSRPDLVLVTRGNPLETIDRLRALGLSVFALDDRTDLEGVRRMVSTLAAVVGPNNPELANGLIQRFWNELRAFRAWSDSLPASTRPAVLFVDPENMGWSAGPGSHVDDLIRLAGGTNVVTGAEAWPRYSPEAILTEDPDLLLFALPDGMSEADALARFASEPGMGNLRAVRERRFCCIPSGTLMRPGPRSLDALEKLAACTQPDQPRPEVRRRTRRS